MVSLAALAFGGLFALTGVAIGGVGVRRLRTWWTMRGMDAADGTAIEEGVQEIAGTAHPVDGTVTAPFTGTDSLVCEHEIERYHHDDDGSNWNTRARETETVPFEIEHAGTTVAVQPEGAQRLLTEEFQVDTGKTDTVPQPVREYVDERAGETIALGPLELGGAGRYRFTEERLDAGEEVYVLGSVERDPPAAPGGSDARAAVDPGDRGWADRLLGDPFVVSDTGEADAERRQLKSGAIMLLFGLIFAGSGVALLVVGS